MAKKKVPFKYKPKAIMERAAKDRKAPTAPPRKKIDWKQLIKSIPKKIAKFFRDVVHELKRVTWPNRKALLTYTVVVFAALAFFSVIIGLFDFLFLQLITLLAGIKI
jgi:preprotein translocase subunit SecE